MKKNIYKVLATSLALGLMAATPATSLTVQAAGQNHIPDPGSTDNVDYGELPDDYWGTSDSGSSNNGNNGSSSSGSTNNDSSKHGQGSNGNHIFDPDSEDNTDYGTMDDNYWGIYNASGTGVVIKNDVTVNVPGVQKFRSVMNANHTVYEVYHCGISRASFSVKDAEGNVVVFKNVTLEQGNDGLWYENITLTEGVDTAGLTVAVTKGDATYLSANLSVSGIKLNGEVALLTTPETDAE